MDIDNIAIVPKISKLQWDMHKYNLDQAGVLKKYKDEKIDAKRILNSHAQLEKTIDRFTRIFYNATLFHRDQVNREILDNFSLVITLGGDNHFQYISHFVKKAPILGINADPVNSVGALTSAIAADGERIRELLSTDHFRVENWARLRTNINKEWLEEATCDIYLGSEKRMDMSRYILEWSGKREEQKSSGVIVSTGAGTTSWYDSACRFMYPSGNIQAKDKLAAKFIVTEPYRFGDQYYDNLSGTLQGNASLRAYSLSDTNVISIDSLRLYPFTRGNRVEISLSNTKLKVIKLRLE